MTRYPSGEDRSWLKESCIQLPPILPKVAPFVKVLLLCLFRKQFETDQKRFRGSEPGRRCYPVLNMLNAKPPFLTRNQTNITVF
jgi:hypothetical protein